MTTEVKVSIDDKDSNVGAIVKALALEISGPSAVAGASKQFLQDNGYYAFHFPSNDAAEEFRKSVKRYLPGLMADLT